MVDTSTVNAPSSTTVILGGTIRLGDRIAKA
jgi:hypothetical protein